MVTLRFDRGPRGFRFSATSPRGVALLVLAYLAAWAVLGQRVARAEAETAVRTYLTFALTRAQVAEAADATPDSAMAERWIAERDALAAAEIATLDVRRTLSDVPLASRSRFVVRVRFATGVRPAVRYFTLRKRRLMAPEVVRETGVWAWRLRW